MSNAYGTTPRWLEDAFAPFFQSLAELDAEFADLHYAYGSEPSDQDLHDIEGMPFISLDLHEFEYRSISL